MENPISTPFDPSSGTHTSCSTPTAATSRSESRMKKAIARRINKELIAFLSSNIPLKKRNLCVPDSFEVDNNSAWKHVLRDPKQRALIVTLFLLYECGHQKNYAFNASVRFKFRNAVQQATMSSPISMEGMPLDFATSITMAKWALCVYRMGLPSVLGRILVETTEPTESAPRLLFVSCRFNNSTVKAHT